MKRIISLVLATLLLFTTAPVAFATNSVGATENLYILSKQCPKVYVDYAKEMVGYLLWDHNMQNPYLGEPFTFSNQDSDIYYFPIYSNNKITLTFRVYSGHNGEPTGVVSPAFAESLNAVAQMTSISNPLRIIYENKDDYAAVMFLLNDYEEEVQITPITTEANNIAALSSDNEFEIINCVPTELIQLSPSTRTSKNLTLSITETQGSNNWCLAYCTAAVMRYRGVSKTATQVMQEIHGVNVSKLTAMGKVNLIPYMQSYNFNILKSENWPSVNTTYLKIISEINSYRPVILNMNSSSGDAHALVARGYEDIKGTTSVWNPWYTYYETVISLNDYTPATSSGSFYIAEYWYN